MSNYSGSFEAFNSHDFAKHNNFDFLSFTSPSDIAAPSADLFETELDSTLEGIDDSQIGYYSVDSTDTFSFLRSEPPTCGPPSTITVSSESAYDTQTTYSSENYFYAGSAYTPTTYSSLSEMDMSPPPLIPRRLGPCRSLLQRAPPAPAHSVGKVYIPRSYSDYTPSTRNAEYFSTYRQQPTVSPNHLSTPLPAVTALHTPPSDDAALTDPRRKFKCTVCSRAFARAFNLKTHMATHDPNRQKPFVCRHRSCGRSFSRKHDLGRHLISIHRDDSVLPSHPSAKKVGVEKGSRSWCEQCGKSYFGKESACDCHNAK
ncbi:hypothetical protein ONZ45_g18828 [Pleurotus djamor]|nr:hypothetical protein ONZ45_g18828 [Pleurotus djamor]